MGSLYTPKLASVVANSRGVRSFGFSFTSPNKIDEILNTTKKFTSGFINANLFVFKPVKLPDKEVQEEVLKAVESLSLNEKYDINIPKEPFYYDLDAQIESTLKNLPSIITFHLDIASINIVKKVQAFGMKIRVITTNIIEAKSIENVGADFIVAQGIEAGGYKIFDQENIDNKIH